PLELLDGVAADAGDVLGAAADLEGEQLLVEGVQVGAEVEVLADPTDGGVIAGLRGAAVAVQGDAQVRRRLDAGQLVDDVPEPGAGGVDQAVHAAGDVQADAQVDVLGAGGRLRVVGGPARLPGEQRAQRQRRGRKADASHTVLLERMEPVPPAD